MKNQLFALLLALTLVFGSNFAGCGSSGSTTDNANTPDENASINDSSSTDEATDSGSEVQPANESETELADDYEVPDSICAYEDITAINPDYPAYYTGKATGTINEDTDLAKPNMAFTSRFWLKLTAYKSKAFKNPNVFIAKDTLSDGSEAVVLSVWGDPGTKYYGTVGLVTLLRKDLIKLKQDNAFDLESGLQATIYNVTGVGNYIKQCVIGVTDAGDDGTSLIGKSRFCRLDKNVDFSVGEILSFGFNLKIVEEKERIMELLKVSSEDDLCDCYDSSYKPVECSVLPSDSDTIPDADIAADNTAAPDA